jgi:hypothetical protein
MAKGNRGNAGRRSKSPKTTKDQEGPGDTSRLTREFRSREHMSYPTQSHPGDEELCRHLMPRFKQVVLGTKET